MGFRGPAFSDQALNNHTLSDASVIVSDPHHERVDFGRSVHVHL